MPLTDQTAHQIVSQLTLAERASLCSGADFWHTKAIERVNLPAVMMSDGPHGLRVMRVQDEFAQLEGSQPATCFPAACATAASFDRDLLRQIGEAIAQEAQAENLAVVLGPGVNIKRHPLCGRNFEYFSEDPFLAGELGSAMVDGIQSQGIGASLKHYAANNQERGRLVNDSEIDERALREIYLSAFEKIIKKSQPWTVMCCYNRVNGVYGSQNKHLLNDILRDEWGFQGLVVSDWGAVSDRVAGVSAGLDLEMPYISDDNDQAVLKAVKKDLLSEQQLTTAAERVVELVLKHLSSKTSVIINQTDHNGLAREAAVRSAVLLKNEGRLLPIKPSQSVALIGQFAVQPRYQGAGSSQINPTMLDNPLEAFREAGYKVSYAQGYDLTSPKPAENLIKESEALAQSSDLAVVFAGLPPEDESEGFDRKNLSMPAAHNELISRVAAANANTVVVLMCGAPVELPWRDQVKSILLVYLGGQAVGHASVDLLTGQVSPSGKLPETWPLTLADTPAVNHFGDRAATQYRESIFAGYRWYDTARREVAYPFGHGLSYTDFQYENLVLTVLTDQVKVDLQVTNTGQVAGSEVVQLYVSPINSQVYRAEKELKGFEKIHLLPGETKQVQFTLSQRAFSYYDVGLKNWNVEPLSYRISVGGSSRDLRLSAEVNPQMIGVAPSRVALAFAPVYASLPQTGSLDISQSDFFTIWHGAIPSGRVWPFTIDSPIGDLKHSIIGRAILNIMIKEQEKKMPPEEVRAMLEQGAFDYPLRFVPMQASLSRRAISWLIKLLNFPLFSRDM